MTHTWREGLACSAGFFNGEGCTIIRYKLQRKDGTYHHYPVVHAGQASTPETLLRFRNAVGMGRISGPFRPYRKSQKVHYQFQIAGFERVQAVLGMLWPWLSTAKKEQAIKTLQKVKGGWR